MSQFPLRVVKIEWDVSPNKKGWDRFKVSIPPTTRGRYADDQIYAQEWSQLMKDFDKKPFVRSLLVAGL